MQKYKKGETKVTGVWATHETGYSLQTCEIVVEHSLEIEEGGAWTLNVW